MIIAISIRSFVLIEQLDLDCSNGFSALTGETGAGKSIILGAIGVVLGGQAPKSLIRKGAERASVSVSFSPGSDNRVWSLLAERGIDVEAGEALTLRRVIFSDRASRAFVNDQPVSAATLSLLGDHLVEIHGQHAASGLMRPSTHRGLLDSFAGNEIARTACRNSWGRLEAARQRLAELEAADRDMEAQREWLEFAVEELGKLAADAGEASQLSARRAMLVQSEKLTETINDAQKALCADSLERDLAKAARAAERLIRFLEPGEGEFLTAALEGASAIERTLIELNEAQSVIAGLSRYAAHDGRELDEIENRLFALRAAGRKYDVEPDQLDEMLARYTSALEECAGQVEALAIARAAVVEAEHDWQRAADKLTETRRGAGLALSKKIAAELDPLQLGRVSVQVSFQPIEAGDTGANGQERAVFEVETNPGSGFGPLQAIASGGELARFSLALKCALSDRAAAETMIFDEVDQGVGGAVAAAIGERLVHLASERQIFAITHSPQVAAYAAQQLRVHKSAADGRAMKTHLVQLDETERLEEIARMLSGSSVTDEARAAASKLLEAA